MRARFDVETICTMEVGKSVSSAGQENKVNHKKSTKSVGHGQSERAVLRPLQPHSIHSTGKKKSPPTLDPTKKSTTSKNKGKVSSTNRPTEKLGQVKKRTCLEKGVQTDIIPTVDYEMCTSETPPAEYWQVLAEQRRQALAETLEENEELHAENKILRDKIVELERRLENKDYFAMMYQLVSKESIEET